MTAYLKRWWTSLGHSVHSPRAFRMITLVLDQRDVTYYPEHFKKMIGESDLPDHSTQQLALQMLHEWPLTRLIRDDEISTVSCDHALIMWRGGLLSQTPWDTESVLWHMGREVPKEFLQREAGIMVDYARGQLLLLDHKLPYQNFWTRIRR